jgi:hypothetical protein
MALLCVNDIEFLYNEIHSRYLRIKSPSCPASGFAIGPQAQSTLGIHMKIHHLVCIVLHEISLPQGHTLLQPSGHASLSLFIVLRESMQLESMHRPITASIALALFHDKARNQNTNSGAKWRKVMIRNRETTCPLVRRLFIYMPLTRF